MTWTRGRRELVLQRAPAARAGRRLRAGHLEHRQAASAPLDKQAGTVLEWQQYTADALVTLAHQARRRRRRREAQPDHADRAPQRRRSRRCSKAPARSAPRQPSDSPATRAASPSSRRAATSCTRASDAAPPTPSNARCTSAQAATASTPAAPPAANSKPTTSPAAEHGGKTELDNLILLCPRHHKLLHDHHIHTNGTADQPVFTDAAGRAITTNQPHAPPR